ncbi:Serine/threonine-protein kinase ATR [Acorus calamus]|uniref:Serine/threonine-protein kinase ATR n=1 Tax=Acorus calamus TaxID=4465 RepID=A0AAV9FNU0_ACOCL|nr:Serine/threonine-protein kinase ATR [Acorus calamus]
MANLASLVHELRERIAASSCPPKQGTDADDDEDPLETRFRTVLPNLLHAYVILSSSANEREVTAVLKLLSYTARNFAGVFFHGRADAVLPVIGRVIPFFAEPAFRSRHGVIFEAVGSLLSLLRTGDREAYRQFFFDSMLVVEDLVSVASLQKDKPEDVASSRELLKCFHDSFSGISSFTSSFSEVPVCCRPMDGVGVMIDLTDILGIELIGHDIPNDNGRSLSPSSGKGSDTNAVGEKRQAQDMDCVVNKRLKTEGTSIANIDVREGGLHTAASLSPNTALVAVSMLCIIFSNHHSSLSIRIFQLMISWMPWICQQANKSSSLTFDLAIYLEAVHSMVLLHGMKSFGDGYGHMDDTGVLNSELPYHSALVHLLKLPWTHSLIATQAHPLWKTKCLSVQLFSMLKFETDLEFLDLALKDEAEEVRFEAIISMPLIIMFSGHGQLTNILKRLEHSSRDFLLRTRHQWNQCIEYLLLHKKKVIREAFSSQIYCFLEDQILDCLFVDEECTTTKEQIFLDKIKHSLKATEDPHVLETLLDSTVEIMNAIDLHRQLFSDSFILLVDHLDNPHLVVRMTASRLINKSCYFHLNGRLDLLLSKFVHIRDRLFDYLSVRVVTQPNLIREFAEGVLGIRPSELIGKMVPVVIPKLVVSQQIDDQAVTALHELAKNLSTDVVPLTVDWLPKVLAFALLRENEQELASALQFYHTQTGSESKEIFAAALPALLDELVCFQGDGDINETNRRVARIPLMIKRVAGALTIEKDALQSDGLMEIRELPLLPSIPALTKVNSIIQEARGSMTLRDQLRNAVNGLNHESLNVRYMMACELSKLLNLKREEITSLIAGEAVSDLDILSSLITSLLRGCAEQSRTVVGQRLKLVCADCLGAFGAIDPAKFKGIPCQRFKIKCSDDDLIFELIHNYLTRAFRAASDTIVQDSAALAIQELLKLAGCQASLDENAAVSTNVSEDGSKDRNLETNNRGQRLWDRFSNYVRDIIAPCLTSKFQLPSVIDSTSIGPIYKPSMSFRRWIYFWIKKLTVHATGSRASIFNACRGIVRHDMQTAVYLLPYLVLNAVCNGTAEARQGITEEILSVLKAAAMDNGRPAIQGVSGGQSEVCIQAVFTLLDNLGQWVDDLRQEAALARSLNSSVNKQTPKGRGQMPETDQLFVQCGNVSELLSAIPKVTLARASFHCQAYARSLRYFESHVQEKSGSFNPAAERYGVFADEDISFLMEIYSGLDEPDGLSGLANLRKSLNLHDQLLINEKVGNWGEVLTSCEQALQMEPTSIQRHSGVLNCLLNMCLLQAMVTHVDGLISRIPQYKKAWCMQGVQAAWRLGRWELMDEYLSGADEEGLVCGSSPEISASFDMDLAKILQAMMKKDSYAVSEKIAQSKQALLVPLAAAGMDSYMRAYPFIVKLHMLCELEDFHALLGDESFLDKTFHPDDPSFAKVMNDWDNRLRFTQPSLWAREPLLAFRRLVFNSSNIGAQVGNCWLQYAKLCRSAGHYETANRAIIEAQASGALNVHIEKAKMLWSSRRSDCAIAELQHSLQNVPPEVLGPSCISSLASLSLVPPNQPSLCAKQASNENWDVARTILLYTRWIHYTGQKQKEDVINLFTRVRELQPKWEKGFFYAAKYYDDLLMDARKRQEDSQEGLVDVDPRRRMIISSISVDGSSTVVSAEEKPWWTYLSDVLLFYARGLHRGHKHLFQALPRLLTLWFEFGSRYNKDTLSSNKALKAVHGRVTCIMRGCLKDLPTYQWLTVLSQLVSRICHQNEDVVRIVKQIITSVLQEPYRTPDQVVLSSGTVKGQNDLTTISGIADEAEILSSLQKPKKVVFIGSDGVQRPFLCKPKDDLRKDARMMEFTAMINRLLSKFPESRRRKLYIRTFAVIPLTEDCGMVEWVPHTRGLRHILQDIYIASGKFDRQKTNPMIKRMYDQCQASKMPDDEMLKTKILPMFPPVFHKWFLTTFSEPAAWFRARVAYAHTTAVWSMVGHIVGLGDRHGENILFDSTTGDCVHVDFSCLFDKGLQLEKPELVPFRLTQNMIDGLGITGYEGIFMKVCEITLMVLRTHKETLMSVLETFIHDPLVEWTKSHKSSGVEVQNPHAQRAISNIKARLQGVVVGVGAAPSLPLAVEGQVRRLIAEAVSHKNLGKIFDYEFPPTPETRFILSKENE